MSDFPGPLRVLATKVASQYASAKTDDSQCLTYLSESPPQDNDAVKVWMMERAEFVARHSAALAKLEPELDRYGAELYDFYSKETHAPKNEEKGR